MLSSGRPLTYHPISWASLKRHRHIGGLSSLHLIRQTPIMRISLVPNLITLLLYNIQQQNHLCRRTRAQNHRQSRRIMTGRVCKLTRTSIFPTNIFFPVSLWIRLRLRRPKISQLDPLLNLMLCLTVFLPMTCQRLLRRCSKHRLSHFGNRGGLYSVACLAAATRTIYLPWMSRTRHFKAKATHHPSSERSLRARIAVRYRKCHRLSPQRLHRLIRRR